MRSSIGTRATAFGVKAPLRGLVALVLASAVSVFQGLDPYPVSAAAGTWSAAGSMTIGRGYGHTATPLPSGKVLVVGGFNQLGSVCCVLPNADLYDPVAGTWSATGSMSEGRSGQTATLLSSGKVLVAGGEGASAELYDPVAGTWSATGSMTAGRSGQTPRCSPAGRCWSRGVTAAATWRAQSCTIRLRAPGPPPAA